MAFVSNEKMAQVRADLRAQFPEIKFKVNRGQSRSYSSIYVTIVSAPYQFIQPDMEYVANVEFTYDTGYRVRSDEYNPQWEQALVREFGAKDVLRRIVEIVNKGNHDRSDSMTDYFDVGFYLNISIGEYGKPFICTGTAQASAIGDLVVEGAL